jgi:hypothetical protein
MRITEVVHTIKYTPAGAGPEPNQVAFDEQPLFDSESVRVVQNALPDPTRLARAVWAAMAVGHLPVESARETRGILLTDTRVHRNKRSINRLLHPISVVSLFQSPMR